MCELLVHRGSAVRLLGALALSRPYMYYSLPAAAAGPRWGCPVNHLNHVNDMYAYSVGPSSSRLVRIL